MNDLRRASEIEMTNRFARATRRDLFIWGAGSAGCRAAAAVRDVGGDLAGFIDGDQAKWGTQVEGRPVFGPGRLLRPGVRPRVLVASMYAREIAVQLRSMGYRAERDFHLLPAEGQVLPFTAADARLFAAWHSQWAQRMGLDRDGAASPAVRMLRVPRRASWREIGERIRDRLPRAKDAWVCLYDDRFKHARFFWRSAGKPGPGCRSVRAVYDPVPLPSASRQRAFLLAHLASSAGAGGPAVLTAGELRRHLDEHTAPVFSLDRLTERVRRTDGDPAQEVAGVVRVPCPPRLVPAAKPQTAPRNRRAGRAARASTVGAAPALVAFAREVADAGRPVFTPDELVQVLPRWLAGLPDSDACEYLRGPSRVAGVGQKLQVVAHSRGNFFFREIRDLLAAAWRGAGAQVWTGDETSRPAGPGRQKIVVAPHEFFVLPGRQLEWDHVEHLVMVNTEQPHTRWFATCLSRLLGSRRVLDLSCQTALLLRLLGADAHFLPLGWDDTSPAFLPRPRLRPGLAFAGMSAAERRLPRSAHWTERPIDVLFVGTLSARRSELLARMTPALARHRCYLHLPPAAQPLLPGDVDTLDGRDMADLCRRTKIVLNVHRDELPYFEWHRLVFQAMRHGALVLTEPSMPVPGLVAGRHFLEAEPEEMPAVIHRLLATSTGIREATSMARAASLTFRRRFPADRVARRSLALVEG